MSARWWRALVLVSTCAVAACGRMYQQPKHKPLDYSPFFDDGRSARPLVAGTVPRGSLIDPVVATGKAGGRLVDTIPVPVTMPLVERGRERFDIFCSPCHDRTGSGNGMVVQRGFRPPPSFHIDRLRAAPDGHFFDVITNGFGAMPEYAKQIPAPDRWAIVAYVRALQTSQRAAAAALSSDDMRRLQESAR